MEPITSDIRQQITSLLPDRFKDSAIDSFEQKGSVLNLYDENGDFVTSVNTTELTEDVIPIDNRLPPTHKEYIVKRNSTRLSFQPMGVPWWHHTPYSGPADFQHFLKRICVDGSHPDLTSQLVRHGVTIIKIPVANEKDLKDHLKKNENYQSCTKTLTEDSNYIKKAHKQRWAI